MKFLHLFELPVGQQFPDSFIHTQLAADGPDQRRTVARQDHGTQPQIPQRGDRGNGIRLQFIGDNERPRIGAADRNRDDRLRQLRQLLRESDPGLLQEAGASGQHLPPVGHAFQPAPGNLRDADLGDSGIGLRSELPDRPRDRMIAAALDRHRRGQQLLAAHMVGVIDLDHLEVSFGQRTGFIQHHRIHFREHVQIVGAFEEDAVARRQPDTAEISERNGDHQRTGTRKHQKHQSPVEPVAELVFRDEKERQNHQRRRQRGHDRRVDAGEPANEVLQSGLALRGLLHQLQNPRQHGILETAAHLKLHRIGAVDHSGQHRVSGRNRHRTAFARQGGRIEFRPFRQQLAVQRNPLPGIDPDAAADRHLSRRYHGCPAPLHHRRQPGTHIHQRGDGTARPVQRGLLKQFADTVEQHHRHPLGILAENERADRRHRHQRKLVEQVEPDHPPPRFTHHAARRQRIGGQIEQETRPRRDRPVKPLLP